MPDIICLTGEIGSGKSEFTQILHDAVPNSISFESREVISEVANEFNDHLRHVDVNSALIKTSEWMNEHFQTKIDTQSIIFTEEEVKEKPELFIRWHDYLHLIESDPKIVEQKIDVENKQLFRPLLQWLGGYFPYKYRAGVWYEEIGRRILKLNPQPKLISVNALRYPHDETTMRQFGSKHKYNVIVVEIIRPGTTNSNDVTERTRDQIKSDCVVVNSGSIADLQVTARAVIDDLPNVRREYKAA